MPRVPLCGEIWRVFIQDDIHSPRPAIVVSSNRQNNMGKVTVVPLSSQAKQGFSPEYHVDISAAETGLNLDGFARCEFITSLACSKKYFQKLLAGPISLRLHARIVNGVRSALINTDFKKLYQGN